MHNVSRTVPPPLRVRSMSMVDYDLPVCQRPSISGASGPPTPILSSPNESESDAAQAAQVAQASPAAAASPVAASPVAASPVTQSAN